MLQGSASLEKQPPVSYRSEPARAEAEITSQALELSAIIDLVRAAACEVSGEEMDENAHFASHHFDSLAAVELANSIGKAVGLSLPSELSLDTASQLDFYAASCISKKAPFPFAVKLDLI